MTSSLRARCALLFLTAAAAVAPLQAQLSGEKALAHPAGEAVSAYVRAIITQDWETASKLVAAPMLQERLDNFQQYVKSAPTMTDESAALEKIGLTDLRELEKLTAQDFYVRERSIVHKKLAVSAEDQKQKAKTLKFTIVALAEESDRKLVHVILRSSHETTKARISEVLFLTLTPNAEGAYVVNTDLQRPELTSLDGTPITGGAPATAPAAPAPAAEKKAPPASEPAPAPTPTSPAPKKKK